MTILSIDTSCDETSVAVTRGYAVLSSVVSSQVRSHRKFGGVVPFLAQRLHKERIDAVIGLALSRVKLDWPQIEAIAVTHGPGLAPALEVGVATAKALAHERGLPLYPVNHMLGHILSVAADRDAFPLPALAVLASGGHTELALVRSANDVSLLGQTLDDALGEAYDKVAKLLGLGYPGGALVAKLAAIGNTDAYELPVPMLRSGDLNLSYSGLKNAVRLLVERQRDADGLLSQQQIADICASFERVAQRSLLLKTEQALAAQPVRALVLAGGVAANTRLRAELRALAKRRGIPFIVPKRRSLCGDNAAMIGVAAYASAQVGTEPLRDSQIDALERLPSLRFPAAEA